jgi:hypothetical protein
MRLRVGGVAKGFPAFQGFGVIERAELIAQYDARQSCSFPNYVFDIAVFDMSRTSRPSIGAGSATDAIEHLPSRRRSAMRRTPGMYRRRHPLPRERASCICRDGSLQPEQIHDRCSLALSFRARPVIFRIFASSMTCAGGTEAAGAWESTKPEGLFLAVLLYVSWQRAKDVAIRERSFSVEHL